MVEIRQLDLEDWKIYREVRLKALSDAPDAFGSTFERESRFGDEDWRKRLARTDCITFVAFTFGDEAVGLVVGGPYDDQAGVYSMWVDRNQRKGGIGKSLVGQVIAWSKARGFSKLLLDVGDFNAAAIGLYEAAGFYKTGVVGTLPSPREHITEHQRTLDLKS